MLLYTSSNHIGPDISISALRIEDLSEVSPALIKTARNLPAKNLTIGTKHPISHHPTVYDISEINTHK